MTFTGILCFSVCSKGPLEDLDFENVLPYENQSHLICNRGYRLYACLKRSVSPGENWPVIQLNSSPNGRLKGTCKMRGHPSSRSRALGKGREGKTKVSDARNTAADCRGASGMKGKTKWCIWGSYHPFYGLRKGWLGIGTGDISGCRISFLKCAVAHRRHCGDEWVLKPWGHWQSPKKGRSTFLLEPALSSSFHLIIE